MKHLQKALICGAGGFIGYHLVRKLKREGYWVRGVDIKFPDYSKTEADEFVLLDLRSADNCRTALQLSGSGSRFDEVYQLAADMGGMGFIEAAESDIVCNNALINIYTARTAAELGIPRYFFSSSACVYRNMEAGESFISEDGAYPALPDNEYGWEKLYSERVLLTLARHYPMEVRIARFQNCYGPDGTWKGGREKAPAALCRKVVEAKPGGFVEVWGDGTALRSYTYVSDIIDGIFMLMQSDLRGPVNIGIDEFVSVNELLATIGEVSGKRFSVKHIEGPVGVTARNHTFDLIKTTGWCARVPLRKGIMLTYPWIQEQVQFSHSAQQTL